MAMVGCLRPRPASALAEPEGRASVLGVPEGAYLHSHGDQVGLPVSQQVGSCSWKWLLQACLGHTDSGGLTAEALLLHMHLYFVLHHKL